MRYVIDLSELSLLDLIDLLVQQALQLVRMDAENSSYLHFMVCLRASLVQYLEDCLEIE